MALVTRRPGWDAVCLERNAKCPGKVIRCRVFLFLVGGPQACRLPHDEISPHRSSGACHCCAVISVMAIPYWGLGGGRLG
jgi:hypothetical protein